MSTYSAVEMNSVFLENIHPHFITSHTFAQGTLKPCNQGDSRNKSGSME